MDRAELPILASPTQNGRGGGDGRGGDKASEAPPEDGRGAPVPGTPFMGVKVRRGASLLRRDCQGDYLDVPSNTFLSSILSKGGDQKLLFADKVLKFTGSGKIKRRIMLITDRAIYLVDPDAEKLKRRIPLKDIDKICLSKLSDNFLAVIVPSEYDCIIATTRKTEVVTVLSEATKSRSELEIGVVFANRFEYHPAADSAKEVHFEQVQGGVKTRITKKKGR